jgi:hypothetical protein
MRPVFVKVIRKGKSGGSVESREKEDANKGE